jgi:toxin ParE1/3/4
MTVKLTLAAEQDLVDIWRYTRAKWGPDQANRYFDELISACDEIGAGTAFVKTIEGLPNDIRVHRRQRHYIFFLADEPPIILAFLHERMDFVTRLKATF